MWGDILKTVEVYMSDGSEAGARAGAGIVLISPNGLMSNQFAFELDNVISGN